MSVPNFLGNATPQAHGAAYDGTTDDAAAVAATQATGGTIFGAGIIRIASATNLTAPALALPGSLIKVDGVALTISAPLNAPPSRVFQIVDGGSVVFSNNLQDRYPEWCGAVPNSSSTDNTAAINASIAAGPGKVRMLGASYYHTGTIVDATPRVDIECSYGDSKTSLNLTSATADHVVFGNPAAGALIPLYSSMHGCQLTRTVAPSVALGSFPFTAAAKGVNVQWADDVRLIDVHTYGSRIGLYRRHTQGTRSERFIAEFPFATYGGEFIGDFVDGQDTQWNGNGSGSNLLVNSATTDTDFFALGDGTPPTLNSVGFRITGNFSDTWLVRPQTAGGLNGMIVDGTGADTSQAGTVAAGTGIPFTSDLKVSNPIFDNVFGYGLKVVNVPANLPVVAVSGGYVLMGGSTPVNGVDIESNGVSIGGGFQVLGWNNTNTSSNCLAISNAHEISIGTDVHLAACHNPVYLFGVAASEISPHIHALDARAAARPAINVVNSAGNHFAPIIDGLNANGTVAAFASALTMTGGAASAGNSIDLTKMFGYVFAGGKVSLSIDGKAYVSTDTAAPYFGKRLGAGTNLISGAQP